MRLGDTISIILTHDDVTPFGNKNIFLQYKLVLRFLLTIFVVGFINYKIKWTSLYIVFQQQNTCHFEGEFIKLNNKT